MAKAQAAAAVLRAQVPPKELTRDAKDHKVRRTVDLSRQRHLALAQWCTETASELGCAKVTSQDVLSALVARLLTDETLARKIRADLQEAAESA